jgi:cytochrome P450
MSPRRATSRDSLLPPVVQTLLLWFRPFEYLAFRGRSRDTPFTIRVAAMPPQVVFRDPRDIGAILSAPEDTLRPGEGGATVAPIVGQRSFMLADGGSHLAGRKATVASFI